MNAKPEWVNAMIKAEPKFKEINAKIGAVDWAIEASFARQAIQASKALAECTPQSIQDAIVNVAAVGLSLNPAQKLAYLVPRDGKCVLDISYQGLLKIATDTGSIAWGRAELVYEGETFMYHGPATLPEHEADPFDSRRGTTDGFRGVYCIAKTADGDYLIDTMPADEVYRIRNCSKAFARYANKEGEEWKAGPWVTFFGEMAKKSIIKRAQKTWPRTDKTARLDQAVHILNQHEGLAFSEHQRDYYVKMIEKGDDPLEFLAFTKSLDQRAHTDLYNHWEYGQKVKMKAEADALAQKGWDVLHECVAEIKEAVAKDNDQAVHEILGDMSPNAQELLFHNLDPAEADYCQQIGYGTAA